MEQESFYHTSVLLQEAVDGLAIDPEGVYVDCTLGGGGHSRAILSKLNERGRLIVFDQDADAWPNAPQDERVRLITENFRYLKKFLRLNGTPAVDGILADLGVSSRQFDTDERGFSIRFDGPLDMRMDRRADKTAADVLKTSSEEALHKMFEWYGEVRNARSLAKHIVTHRGANPLRTTDALKALVRPMIRGNEQRYFAQLFQALRIEVNDELGALRDLLEQAAECLNPGGRLSIISFHSLEDRLVKQYIKQGVWEVSEDVLGLAPKVVSPFKEVFKKPIEPSAEEQKNNPRSRSAKLRVAEKK